MRRMAVAVVMVVVVCLLFWAGWHNLRSRRVAMQQAQQAQVTVTRSGGDSSSPQGTHQGKPAPAFTLLDTTGKKVSLADYKGRPVVVNFWATWCGPCKVEMPWFEEFSKKYAPDGLEILGMTFDVEAGKPTIEGEIKKMGVTYPVVLTDTMVQTEYLSDSEVLPMSFYVDKSGTVMQVTAGLSSKADLEAQVKAVIAAGAK